MIPSSSSSRTSITPHPRSDSLPRNTDNGLGGSMRPRNRRLVSTLDEQELVTTSATSTPGGSRAVSPIPQKHPSRIASRTGPGDGRREGKGKERPVGGLLAPPAEIPGRSSSPMGFSENWNGGWMSSWSTLRGIANSVLGGAEDSEGWGPGNGSSAQERKPRRKPEEKTWGPESLPRKNDGGIGQGSTAEREAAVRTKKMMRVLEGREDRPNILDTNGNYKHRTSMEEQQPENSQDDEDALVYIHHVLPSDTLAGVVLRYNCQPAVFRKANRFWPNDSIHIRKVVMLPVDACAIKGRPCHDPTYPDQPGIDLLAPTPDLEQTANPFSNVRTWPEATFSNQKTSAERPPEDDDSPWVHVRWVLLDNSPSSKPVEIARMPRKTLGYFPPRRRKSQATLSTVSTPRESSEFPQLLQSLSQLSSNESALANSSTTSTPPRRTSNLGPRPSQPTGGYFPPSTMASTSTRPRRESVGEAADRLGWMRGPGGVGTLGKNVRMPGPGTDSMNSWVKKYIPSIAIDSLPSSSALGAETAHFGFSDELASIAESSSPYNNSAVPSATSGASTPGNNGVGNLGLENAAAAIEGWVRRIAVKGPGTPRGGGRTEAADLIELLDGTGSDDGRGFELSPGRVRSSTPSGRGREDLEGSVRGRASAGAKAGKSD